MVISLFRVLVHIALFLIPFFFMVVPELSESVTFSIAQSQDMSFVSGSLDSGGNSAGASDDDVNMNSGMSSGMSSGENHAGGHTYSAGLSDQGKFSPAFNFWWLTYPLLGLVVGFLAGLLGVGGGGVMVPMLTTLFLAQGFPREDVVHMALGTSMAAIIFTSVSSMRAHHARGAVVWKIVRRITPGILVGTFLGTFVASRLNTVPLAVFFACFMSFVAVQMWHDVKPKPSRELPGRSGMSAAGMFIGFISALVAIGGGALSVPFMIWCNTDTRRAIGTSAAIGFPIALAGTVGYLVNGWVAEGMLPHALGYIYLPALVLTGGFSALIAPLGAACSQRVPVAMLKKIFAGIVVLLVLKMLHGVFG